MAISLQLQPHASFGRDAKKFHASTMQAETRFYFLKRTAHSSLEVERMQSVQEQQVRHEPVLRKFVDQRRARIFVGDFESAV